MTNILFLLIGFVVLDIILSKNRRRSYRRPPYRDDMYYHQPPYYPHQPYPPSYNSSDYRHHSDDYPYEQREYSPVTGMMLFMIMVLALFFGLAH